MVVKRSTILVPVDFSPECPLILRVAEDEAARAEQALLLLHVVGMGSPLRQRPPLILTDPLEDCVRAIKRIPAARVSFLALEGEPVEEILNVAELSNCCAIIMGRGGSRERLGHVALGIQRGFRGKLRLISRFDAELPAVA